MFYAIIHNPAFWMWFVLWIFGTLTVGRELATSIAGGYWVYSDFKAKPVINKVRFIKFCITAGLWWLVFLVALLSLCILVLGYVLFRVREYLPHRRIA